MLDVVQRHPGNPMKSGTDRYGPVHTPMLMATIAPVTRSYSHPDDRKRDGVLQSRACRFIHAPKGCSAY